MATDSRMARIRQRKTARTEQVPIVVDRGAAADIEATLQKLRRVAMQLERLDDIGEQHPGSDSEDRRAVLEGERDELKALLDGWVADESLVIFHFKSCGRAQYEELRRDNPPVEGSGIDYGPEFPPMLIAACATDPQITVNEALDLWDDPEWSEADCQALFAAALATNRVPSMVQLGKDWGGTTSTA